MRDHATYFPPLLDEIMSISIKTKFYFAERARRGQERAEVDFQDGGRRLQLRPRRGAGDPGVLCAGMGPGFPGGSVNV